jgi:hypothetical protein
MPDEQYDLIKCGLCGKAFAHEVGSRTTCPDCLGEEDALYRKVRNLLSDYPDRRMGAAEVAKLLGVEERKVNYLVESGMFTLATDIGVFNWHPGD